MNTPSENIIKTLSGKKCLFLENGNSLNDGLDELERIIKKEGIEYKVLFDLSELPLSDITYAINIYDVIIFQTRWVYEISHVLLKYIRALPNKKIVIECYISEPSWYYKRQHGSKHDVYIYSCPDYFGEPQKEYETFYKLTNKPYWEYKNNFDK